MVARRIGTLLAGSGALADPEDVFYLTADELESVTLRESLGKRIAPRRAERESYTSLELPTSWRGRPVPSDVRPDGEADTYTGVAASPGVVEGPVRVLTEPDCDDLEPGEILVAPVTDPSWAAIMFVSAGLVVEIGGALSHAAVVAREIGVPCVMAVSGATTNLRNGDICRVDGRAGTVDVIQRSGSSQDQHETPPLADHTEA